MFSIEFGICHTIDKPTILIKNKNDRKRLPFDIQNYDTIYYNYENIKDLENRLENQIKDIMANKIPANPIDTVSKSEIMLSMFDNFWNIINNFLKIQNHGKDILELNDRYSDHGQDYEITKNIIKRGPRKRSSKKNQE